MVQDPDNPRKRIYKVFDRIEDIRQEEEGTGHQILATGKVAANKAVRAAVESSLTTKASSSTGGDMDLWGGLGLGEKQPKKTPKPKKEKTPEELEKKAFDTDLQKSLGFQASTLSVMRSYKNGQCICCLLPRHVLKSNLCSAQDPIIGCESPDYCRKAE